jgi:DNA (cytosine-5)-methyltransferase 1
MKELVIKNNKLEEDFIMKYKPKVISLFSGCGGLDFGFHKAGFDIVYANDIEPSVEATYKANLGDIDIRDIRNVDKQNLPECDVVIAGIPCQPFSSAGNRGSTNDTRGNLFLEVMKIVDIKKPKIVLFENVRGFLSAKDSDGIVMPERLRCELKNHGYFLHYKLLNASDYGVPQNRHRVIFIGIREDVDIKYEFPNPLGDKQSLTVRNVIEKPFPDKYIEEVWDLSPQAMNMTILIPEGGSWKSVAYENLPNRLKKIRDEIKKYRSPNFYRKFSRDEIMGTITAAATPENSGILHPLEFRRYSVREIARFQSFPDDFQFIGTSIPKKYKMIGNAVPCELAYNIAKSLKIFFN